MTDFLAAAQQTTDFQTRYRLIVAACEAEPHRPECWFALGSLLHQSKRWAPAIAAFSRADELYPRHAPTLHGLGDALFFTNRSEEAKLYYIAATEADPKSAQSWAMLAQLVGQEVQGDLAIQYARDAVRLAEGLPLAHMALKTQLWMEGQWEEGFREYEWRFAYRIPEPLTYPFPLWRGEQVDTLLVQAEQGLGDTVMGLRWGHLIGGRAKHIIFYAHNEIVPLLETTAVDRWWDELHPMPRYLPKVDAWIGLWSLPVACGMAGTGDTAPFLEEQVVPYVAPYVDVYGEVKPAGPGLGRLGLAPSAAVATLRVPLRVGIVWSGAEDAEEGHLKNIPLAEMLRLAEVPGVELHSLQIGPAAKQMGEVGAYGIVKDRSPEIHSMLDTAKIIHNLDLVVSVDTAVAHLAGAMDKPVWLLLNQRGGDGRWRRRGSSTIWYPSMQIFRRDLATGWGVPLTAVCDRLRSHVEIRNAR